jgi:hypothetical protein
MIREPCLKGASRRLKSALDDVLHFVSSKLVDIFHTALEKLCSSFQLTWAAVQVGCWRRRKAV